MNDESNAKLPRGKGRRPLADQIYHALVSRIVNGEYPVNHRLPSENQLSEELGVSRPVLRAALEKLRGEGVIYSRQGAGNFVRASSDSPVGFARVATLADVQRCYEFRLTIEVEAASMAALRRNSVALRAMEEALELLQDATGNKLHSENADFAFHLAICQAANNHYFEASMRALREHINVGMKLHGQSLMSDGARALQHVLEEHGAIFQAIRDQNAAHAAVLMRKHLEGSRERLFGGGLMDLRMPEPSPDDGE